MTRNLSAPIDLYQAVGGAEKCLELAVAFYSRVGQEPALVPLFPGKSHRCAIEAFSAFLAQLLAGPSQDAASRWWLSLQESHQRFKIGAIERDAWLRTMMVALDAVAFTPEVRSALRELFNAGSNYLVNSGERVQNAVMEVADSAIHVELGCRWEEQLELDKAVAAARNGEAGNLAALIEGPALRRSFARNVPVFANLVGLMIGSGHPNISNFATQILQSRPELAHESYSGRSLLHAAAAAGNAPIVELLLKFGVDPNLKTAGGHTPLYCLCNQCWYGGGRVVKVLIQGGAQVDAADGVKQCTPLHMAARRGNVELCQALLDAGANLEARDSLGDTPLRRAVNCRKPDVAQLLLERGGNNHSVGNKALTPFLVARRAKRRTNDNEFSA